MTQCTQTQFLFEEHFSRQVVAEFSGEQLSTDGGALLLREVDRKIHLLPRVAECFYDGRDAERIEHALPVLLGQRICGLALGYEDLNDHEQLRYDPLLATVAGQRDPRQALAGKSTLNRMELSPQDATREQRYHKITYSSDKLDRLLVDIFLEAHSRPPCRIVLDLDVTDIPLHGEQEGRFFHGYYNQYCYLPLYIFSGDHLLCARLRTSNQDASAGCLAEVKRIVQQIKSGRAGHG
jgi:hypothetical protein